MDNKTFKIVNAQRSILRSILLMIFTLIVLYSCKKQIEMVALPMDKLYILEYVYTLPKGHEDPCYKFYVGSFCEIDKDFNVKYAERLFYNSPDFYNSRDIIPDSLRSKISKILLKYQADTTFLYQGGYRVYNGTKYLCVMQKNNRKNIAIKFDPEFLPEDLKFIYLYLYENRKNKEDKSTYNELLEMFENQVKDDTLEFPPPLLKATIKFTPP